MWYSEKSELDYIRIQNEKLKKYNLLYTDLMESIDQCRNGYKRYYTNDGKYLLYNIYTKEWILASELYEK